MKTLFRSNNFVKVIINPSRKGRFLNLSSLFKSLKYLRCHLSQIHTAINSFRTMCSGALHDLKCQNKGADINFMRFTQPLSKTQSAAHVTKQGLNMLKEKKRELCTHVNYLQLEIDPVLNGFLRRRLYVSSTPCSRHPKTSCNHRMHKLKVQLT